jgi:hypothetical protein
MLRKKSKLISGVILGILFVGFTYSCGSSDYREDATTVGENGWFFEGWSCAPIAGKSDESPAEYCKYKTKDYLYMKVSARASENAIRKKSIAMKRSTCTQAAEDQIKGNGLSKIIGDFLESMSGVADGQSTGSAILRQTRGKIRGVGLYNCCSLDLDTGFCAEKGDAETWDECMCVGYIKFPGGQDAFETMAEESEGL